MATKKTSPSKKSEEKAAAAEAQLALSEAFEKAVEEFSGAVELMHQGEYATAKARFEAIRESTPDEPVLSERAASFARICEVRIEHRPQNPETPEECYYQAVIHSNNGECDDAIRLLNRALESDPTSPRFLFARASAYALKGNTDAAVGDLRQAIAADPQVRFQAGNDSDFERIREEPAFIDIIEPTPTGA